MKMKPHKRTRIIASVAVLASLTMGGRAIAANAKLPKNGWNGQETVQTMQSEQIPREPEDPS